jgi:SAM-dependent methyltransferase
MSVAGWDAIAGRAAGGVAIDVDKRSLAAASWLLRCFPGVSVEERSAYDHGDEDRFDIAFSVGVVPYLKYPVKALTGMVRAVKPGGKVLIWLCGLENNRDRELPESAAVVLFSSLLVRIIYHLSLYPTVFLWIALSPWYWADRIFPPSAPIGFFTFALDRPRSNAAEDCSLLAARDRGTVDERTGA